MNNRYWRYLRCPSCLKLFWAGVHRMYQDSTFLTAPADTRIELTLEQQRQMEAEDRISACPEPPIQGIAPDLEALKRELENALAGIRSADDIIDPEEVFAIIHPEIISD